VAATGVLTFTLQPNDGDTVTIGDRTYTFQTTLTSGAGNVFIGAAATNTIDNLIAAINFVAGEGTLYGFGQESAHPLVTVAAGAGDTMDVTAIEKGLSGNSIATAESTATVRLEWTTAMSSGVDPTLTDTAHGLLTGEHPIQVSTDTTLPAGLTANTEYWPITVDANTFKVAGSRDAARRNRHIDITDTGTGIHSWFRAAEDNVDIHAWAKVAKAEQLDAEKTDIDSIVATK
jgi:hypothetical protein